MKKKIIFIFSMFFLMIIIGSIVSSLFFKNFKSEKPIVKEEPVSGVCKVKGNFYDSLQKALDYNMDDLTIEVIKDIEEEIVVKRRTITIIGNGHEIKSSVSTKTDKQAVITVIDSDLKLIDLTIKGVDISKTKIGCGIKAIDSSVSLEKVQIKDFTTTTKMMNELPFGIGFYICNTKTSKCQIDIKNTIFSNIYYNFIHIENLSEQKGDIVPAIRIKLEQNHLIGNFNNEEPQIGIILMGNVMGSISNTIFENFTCQKNSSYGIYMYLQQNQITLNNNQFLAVQKSIYQQFKR